MNATLNNVANDMFVSLKDQLEAITKLHGEYLPALAEVPFDGELEIKEVSTIIGTILGLFSALNVWYYRYECDVAAKDGFKLVLQRFSIYGA